MFQVHPFANLAYAPELRTRNGNVETVPQVNVVYSLVFDCILIDSTSELKLLLNYNAKYNRHQARRNHAFVLSLPQELK